MRDTMNLSRLSFVPAASIASSSFRATSPPTTTPLHAPRHHAARPRPHTGPSCIKQPASSTSPMSRTPTDPETASDTSTIAHIAPGQTFAIATAASTVGSLIGAGGGVLLTPLLTLFRTPQHVAHGTSLVVITATAFISSLRYASSSSVDPVAAALLALPALFTSPLGASYSSQIDARLLRRQFAVFLMAVSILIPLLPHITAFHIDVPRTIRYPLFTAVGSLTGFLSGLLGIGGGTINVPVLVVFAGLSQKLAQGTAMLAMLFPSIRGAITHSKLGHVANPLLPFLIPGAILGALLGSSVALQLPESTLRLICSFVFAAISVRYFTKS